jgi:hypothetical protein
VENGVKVDIIRRIFAYAAFMTSQYPWDRVYISFQRRNGWHCQFLEQDLKTSLPRKLHFASPDKVVELVERGAGLSNLESRQALDQAIETGRGGVFLSLTAEQYARLLSSPTAKNRNHQSASGDQC